jgi:hypothetical protein
MATYAAHHINGNTDSKGIIEALKRGRLIGEEAFKL